MPQNHSEIDAFASIRPLLDGRTPQQVAVIVAAMSSAAMHTAAALDVPPPPPAVVEDRPEYTPHALDVLVVAVIQLDGPQTRSQIVAEVEGQEYRSRGNDSVATEGTIKRRIARLCDAGVIKSTPSGYVISDEAAVAQLEKTDFK